MKQDKLKELLAGNFADVVNAIAVKPKKRLTKYDESVKLCANPLEELNVNDHPIFDRTQRKDVEIKEKQKDADGKETMITTGYRKVNRIGIALEELIAGRAATFLCANPVKYLATPENTDEEKMYEAFKRVNEQNKLDYKNLSILKRRMSELQALEIYYMEDIAADDEYWSNTDVKATLAPRVFIASPSLLDEIYPVWDNEKLIAVGRKWKEDSEDGKDINHFDLYTKDKIYEATEEANVWAVVETITNGKLPAIYHSQPLPEWENARTEIRRLEFLASNHADSNDKTMSPILFVTGPKGAVELPKGEAQRAMRGDKDTDAKYITADNAPQSLALEMKNLWKFALETTNTVDISPETVQGIGNISGYGIEQLFLPALMKAAEHAGTFGECIQRRINLIKAMIVAADPSLKAGLSLQIKPQFDYFMPKDVAGITNYLATAVTGGFLSKETATNILQAALGGDGGAEFDRVKAEPKEDPLSVAFSSAA
jgi:hypothetical protein